MYIYNALCLGSLFTEHPLKQNLARPNINLTSFLTMKITGGFLLLSLALFFFFSDVAGQEKDKTHWMKGSEGRVAGRGILRRRLFQVDCSEFQDPKMYCTRESNPHCGSDGQTYGNKCAFCKASMKSGGKISLKHQGKC
ncbi:serine protease inhibitor Kazal-type 6-like isoform X1 [Tachyglossus aculeatus]|uniref:serine protease inhibitor Kazal-type 6-like isoform X1 n=1 Tax=Tachyglossus aculeatus TaxID=9261 RepID=UPI0018F3B81B|nr:serine protease inhibitor Kazal-type 6-like isoform X1 [Tachyglossus aculeatus]